MITVKCQSFVGRRDKDTMNVSVSTLEGGAPSLSFATQSKYDEILLDVEQVAKLGAALTKWAKENGIKPSDPKKFVGTL
jgi:hypothetical protein